MRASNTPRGENSKAIAWPDDALAGTKPWTAQALLIACCIGLPLLLPMHPARAQQSPAWAPVELDQGRFKALLPAGARSEHFHNLATKVSVGPDVIVSLNVVHYAAEAIENAVKDPLEFLRAHSRGMLQARPGGKEESSRPLNDPDYAALDQRFRYIANGPAPAAYSASRSYLVDNKICQLLILFPEDKYQARPRWGEATIKRFYDSLKMDRARPPGRPFTLADKNSNNWPAPAADMQRRFASAEGLLHEKFAFCQAMSLDDFHWVANELRPSGYRPITFRPFVSQDAVQVAAVWTRDAGGWMIGSGQFGQRLVAADQGLPKGFSPNDVAGWESDGQLFFGVLWRRFIPRRGPSKLFVGVPLSELPARRQKDTAAGHRPRRRHRLLASNGKYHQSLVSYIARPNAAFRHVQGGEAVYKKEMAKKLVPYDVSLTMKPGGGILYLASLSNSGRMYREAHGLSPSEHLRQCRRFVSADLQPVALSVVDAPGEGLVAASIWHEKLAEP